MRLAFCLCLALTLLAGPAAAELKLTNPTEIDKISTQWPLGLAASGSTLYVAYVDSKGQVQVRTYDAAGKSASFPVPSMPSGVSAIWNPALAVFNGNLYVAFTSGPNNGDANPIYVASYPLGQKNPKWTSFESLPDKSTHVYGQSDHAPALAVAEGWLWLVGKNNEKHTIGQAWFGGKEWGAHDTQTCWPENYKDYEQDWGVESSTFPTSCTSDSYAKNQILTINPAGIPQTPQAPSLTYDEKNMQLAYRGGVYDSDKDLEKMYLLTGSTSASEWQEPVQISNFESYLAPAIVSVGRDLGIFFSNHADSDDLAFSAYNGSSWSAPVWAGKQPDTQVSRASSPTATPFEGAGKIAYSIIHDSGKTAYLYFADYSQ